MSRLAFCVAVEYSYLESDTYFCPCLEVQGLNVIPLYAKCRLRSSYSWNRVRAMGSLRFQGYIYIWSVILFGRLLHIRAEDLIPVICSLHI